MKIVFDAWVRIEGVVESDNPILAYKEFTRIVKSRLSSGIVIDCGVSGNLIVEEPSYQVNDMSVIRCFDVETLKNIDYSDK
jgi:hypothetical protein